MKAMICKMEKDFETEFFECVSLDDLLDILDKYGYPIIQITLEDGRSGDPRMSIEVMQ